MMLARLFQYAKPHDEMSCSRLRVSMHSPTPYEWIAYKAREIYALMSSRLQIKLQCSE